MKARIKLVEGVAFMGESDSGHGVVLDGSPEIGGRNLGNRPMELVLVGLAGCTAMDVSEILRKSRQRMTDLAIEVDADRAPDPPRVFTRIHLRYRVTGHGLQPAAVQRAVDLSAEKYCSVSAMLRGSAAITHEIELVEAGSAAEGVQ